MEKTQLCRNIRLLEDLSDRKLSELLFQGDRSKQEYKISDHEYVHGEQQKTVSHGISCGSIIVRAAIRKTNSRIN